MNISEQAWTWALFLGLTKWVSLATAVVILFLTVWFGVGAGFFTAFLVSVVVSVIGFFMLKTKKAH
ncbi:MAG TPA: aa3-type cytochrome c oxidase subunit IV [Brevundimonas sp.]|nr:aa3-type cytochrome c oxidase subunit IV [Chakrabartia godavariana]HAC00792.1 aa3-type cytochrome c oxidase subunit IV [Brevundimonas sp.]HAL07518.1 aa3-type cytochrome c oxidase subunit IV [Brevundimonas sp.]HBV11885.1 aa3-type cytochrome c oxidase subunit IV [Brevundimonas sp.]HCW49840.1 aa3-type cytochrome c oxidase subunit IV [Brevundimonas sp.]